MLWGRSLPIWLHDVCLAVGSLLLGGCLGALLSHLLSPGSPKNARKKLAAFTAAAILGLVLTTAAVALSIEDPWPLVDWIPGRTSKIALDGIGMTAQDDRGRDIPTVKPGAIVTCNFVYQNVGLGTSGQITMRIEAEPPLKRTADAPYQFYSNPKAQPAPLWVAGDNGGPYLTQEVPPLMTTGANLGRYYPGHSTTVQVSFVVPAKPPSRKWNRATYDVTAYVRDASLAAPRNEASTTIQVFVPYK
jgi:hypothetical protein